MSYAIFLDKVDNKAYLMHHGVKGMKKGVRRWQYEDGTYTPEGRIHYGIGQGRKGGTAEKANKAPKSSNDKPEDFEGERNKLEKSQKKLYRKIQLIRDKDFLLYGELSKESKHRINELYGERDKVSEELRDLRERKYAFDVKSEKDERFIDPSYRTFDSKEEKAKAEEQYLKLLNKDPDTLTKEDSDRVSKEYTHMLDKISHFVGEEAMPKTDRLKDLYYYDNSAGDDTPEFFKWHPKYELTKEWQDAHKEVDYFKMRKLEQPYYDKVVTIVLEEMGYEVNPVNLEEIHWWVFPD